MDDEEAADNEDDDVAQDRAAVLQAFLQQGREKYTDEIDRRETLESKANYLSAFCVGLLAVVPVYWAWMLGRLHQPGSDVPIYVGLIGSAIGLSYLVLAGVLAHGTVTLRRSQTIEVEQLTDEWNKHRPGTASEEHLSEVQLLELFSSFYFEKNPATDMNMLEQARRHADDVADWVAPAFRAATVGVVLLVASPLPTLIREFLRVQ